jgi:hypothetical protein
MQYRPDGCDLPGGHWTNKSSAFLGQLSLELSVLVRFENIAGTIVNRFWRKVFFRTCRYRRPRNSAYLASTNNKSQKSHKIVRLLIIIASLPFCNAS